MSAQHLGHLSRCISFSQVDGPGNRFVVFVQGCNFNCIPCHNPQTISSDATRGSFTGVPEIIEQIRDSAPFLSGITVSGGEATQQPDFIFELFEAIKNDADLAHLTTFVDSNGSASKEVWNLLNPVMDGAMIDLKAFDPESHSDLTGNLNVNVLESIILLSRIGKLYEVRLLIAPDYNDSPAAIARTASWLQTVAPKTRIKVIGFRSHGTRRAGASIQEPSPTSLAAIATQFRDSGFEDVMVI